MCCTPGAGAARLVRTGDEPVRESQLVVRVGVVPHADRAHRRRAGAGVSTPTSTPLHVTPLRCGSLNSSFHSLLCRYVAGAYRRRAGCGSINPSRMSVKVLSLEVRTGDEPVRELWTALENWAVPAFEK